MTAIANTISDTHVALLLGLRNIIYVTWFRAVPIIHTALNITHNTRAPGTAPKETKPA